MSLHRLIADRIRASGPISIAEYMTECLLHPQYGYYTTRDPLGRAGDFITAPEISQMFGELIGLALAQCWIDQGRPPAITLAELGPGRGTLMADALRAAASVPGFTKAAHIVLIEASPTLRSLQQQALAGHDVTWTDSISDLPDQPLFLIANEFFDALPIRQFIRDENLWRERRVGVQDGTLGFGLGTPMPQPGLAHRLADTADGDLVEHCAPLTAITESIAARIAAHGGAALIIDYGDWRTLGDTLQAIRDHAPVDPLIDPGQCDLTAHVDFEALALAATPCQYTRLTPQGMFLERLGITNRAQTLAKSLSGPQLDEMVAAHRRLTHPEEMGNLFKVIGLYPAQAAPPPGLNP
jgi:SAM-dependent MidA family methyltransferase